MIQDQVGDRRRRQFGREEVEHLGLVRRVAREAQIDGQDTLIGGRDDDDLAGGAGDDRLFGNLGDDTLSGGDGEDTIVGGPGDDSQEGGADADVFVLAPGAGSDVIADFAAGEDALDLTAFGFADAEAVRDLLVSGTADATLAFDADSQVVLSGVAAGDLTDDAFLL
jgi:Ca2+-binding RTX toxin-like protein